MAVKRQILAFDMDGVLVEVGESYRETIVRTVEHFTGARVPRETLQELKNQGGWNNDFELSHKLIRDRGVETSHEEVVERFQKIFFGNGSDGLILRERWIAQPGLLERLSERFQLALFTGRSLDEARPTLARFAGGLRFEPAITAETVTRSKPAPDGLLRIREMAPGQNLLAYVGDTVDDARAARAASVPFIGIAAAGSPRREELIALLEAEDAIAILEDINQLEAVLPA